MGKKINKKEIEDNFCQQWMTLKYEDLNSYIPVCKHFTHNFSNNAL